MEPEGSCACDAQDPTEYLDHLKKKYLDRTTKLQAQQMELESKIMQMEAFLGKNQQPASCICDTGEVPKVFPKYPDTPERDVPNIPKVISEQKPPTQQCSFFQKMMDNAKSILSIKCPCPSINQTTDSLTKESVKRTIDLDNTVTDKSSSTACNCDESEASTLQDVSCSCMKTPEINTLEAGQQYSASEKTKSQEEPVSKDTNNSSTKPSASSSCPWKDNPSSELVSGFDCDCEVCKCDSSIVDEKKLDFDNSVPTETPVQPVVKSESPTAGVQATYLTENKGVNSKVPRDTASKAVTCCCSNKRYPNNAATTATATAVACAANRDASQRQHELNQCSFIGSPLLKPTDVQAVQTEKKKSLADCDCNTSTGPRKICDTSVFSLTSKDIMEMQNVAELAKKEKEMKNQIEELQRREKAYQEVTKNMDNLMNKSNQCFCCPCGNNKQQDFEGEIRKVSQELKLENNILKSELMDMKLELKHCLEKIEGPMKQKLETEKQKCEHLQMELQNASKNMLMNQDSYSREMNSLKLQLCCACSNITDLNQMNMRLKDEMSQLDCMCAKLENDLIKQKINEADTIKRLTNRRYSGDAPAAQSEEFHCDSNLAVIARKLSKTLKESAPCKECSKLPAEFAGAAKCIKDLTEMVLNRQSRKSSSNCCCCQSNVPSRHIPHEPEPELDEEDCCSCCCMGPRKDFGGGEAPSPKKTQASQGSEEKPVETLLSVPESFAQKGTSSKFEVGMTQSSYYSAKGEPCRDESMPCAKIGRPCVESRGTITKKASDDDLKISGRLPCSGIGEPCHKVKKVEPKKSEEKTKASIACKAPCSEILEPVRDKEVDKALGGIGDKIGNVSSVTSSLKRAIGSIPQEIIDKLPVAIEEEPTDQEDEQPDVEKQLAMGLVAYEDLPDDTTTQQALGLVVSDDLPDDNTTQQALGLVVSDDLPDDTTTQQALGLVVPDDLPDDTTTQQALGLVVTDDLPDDTTTQQALGLVVSDDLPDDTTTQQAMGLVVSNESIPDDNIDTIPQDEPERIEAVVDPSAEPDKILDRAEEPSDTKAGPIIEPILSDGDREPSDGPKKLQRPEESPYRAKEIPVEEENVGEFPFDVENKAFEMEKPPTGFHVTTTVTNSGTLEVITEAPEGIIETTLTYTDDGNIEITTEMTDLSEDGKPTGKKATQEPPGLLEMMDKEPSSEIGDSDMIYADMPKSGGAVGKTVKAIFPVKSSLISGPSGPEIETPYTPSSVTAELTSNLSADSSGVKNVPHVASDLTSTETPTDQVAGKKSAYEGVPHAVGFDDGLKDTSSGGVAEFTGPTSTEEPESKGDQMVSEGGLTSIEGDVPSNEVFTPGREMSDEELAHQKDIEDQIVVEDTVVAKKVSKLEKGDPKKFLRPAFTESAIGLSDVVTDFGTGDLTGLVEEESDIIVKPDKDIEPREDSAKSQSAREDTGLDYISPLSSDIEAVQTSQSAIVKKSLDQKELGEISQEKITDESKTAEQEPTFYDQTGVEATQSQTQEVSPETKESALSTHPHEDDTMGTPLDDTYKEPTMATKKRQTTDCGCQSKDQTDQSCQCCECKEVGITTSGDKETITETDMCKSAPEPTLDDSKDDTDSEFVTISETTDNARAQETEMKSGDTMEEISNLHESKLEVDEEMLKKYPELDGKTSQEQKKILQKLGHIQSTASKTAAEGIDEDVLRETEGMTQEEKQKYLKDIAEKSQAKDETKEKSLDEEEHVKGSEDLVAKHQELAGKSKKEQRQIMKDLGYTADEENESETLIDDKLLSKHSELAGKSKKEQQKILKDLGYSATDSPEEDIQFNEETLEKHPELKGKPKEEQQQILKDLGYKSPKEIRETEVDVDDEVLSQHPELIGKNKEEQQKMLKDLGYKPKVTKPVRFDKEMTEKHPELVGKTSEEKREILGQLGYDPETLTPIEVDPEILEKYPQLVGKSPTEQKEILSKLGVTPSEESREDGKGDTKPSEKPGDTPKMVINQDILDKHPELQNKTSEEQRQMLADIGYNLDEVTHIPSQDVVTTASNEKPSSKDESVSCKASCRSATTIHDDSAKPSGRELTIGDSSSKNVSLQKRPSSRDESASCRASCRTISVQSSSTKTKDTAESPLKEVDEIISPARQVLSSTSSTDKEKEKEREKKKSRMKRSPEEVPSIVSQLSDKEHGPLKPSKKSKTPRRKRSSSTRMLDQIQCDCKDICRCIVCSPDVIERRKQALSRPGRSCDCPSPQMMHGQMMMPQMMMPQMMVPQMAYSVHPQARHPAGCTCNECGCRPCTPCPPDYSRATQNEDFIGSVNYESRPVSPGEGRRGFKGCKAQKKRGSVDEVYKRPAGGENLSDENRGGKKINGHPPNCECVDCLTLPKIKQLAQTKEYPVVFDKKQVFQVKVKCGCVNAQNSRQYAEQQRSRIPISVSSQNPPRVKSDSSTNKAASKPSATPIDPKISSSGSVYQSACDCVPCECTECPDPSKQKPTPKESAPPKEEFLEKNEQNCCCKGPCTCDTCPIEVLTRQLKEAESKLANSVLKDQKPSGVVAPAPVDLGHDEDCDCSQCVCPATTVLKEKPSKSPSTVPSDQQSAPTQDEECTCSQCVCPGAPLLKEKLSKSPSTLPNDQQGAPTQDEECSCPECTCPGVENMKSPSQGPGGEPEPTKPPDDAPGTQPEEMEEDCTCPECACPGVDTMPKKLSKSAVSPKASKQAPSIKSIPSDCECPTCSCLGAKDKPSAISKPDLQVGDMPDDCTCKVCECPGKTQLLPKESSRAPITMATIPELPQVASCDCPNCKCAPCADPKKSGGREPTRKPDDDGLIASCDCVECKCDPCADANIRKGAQKPAVSPKLSEKIIHPPDCECPECKCLDEAGDMPQKVSKEVGIPEKVSHPPDCDCDECMCLEEIIQAEMGTIDTGTQPPIDKAVHSPDCACPECLCVECTTEGTHSPTCNCPECICLPCDLKPAGDVPAKVSAVKSEHHPAGCSCIKCHCDACTRGGTGEKEEEEQGQKSEQVDPGHGEGCTCVKCLCNECIMKLDRGKDHPEDCQCVQCLCVDCLKKLRLEDLPVDAKQSAIKAVHTQSAIEAVHTQSAIKAVHTQSAIEAVHTQSAIKAVHTQSAIGAVHTQSSIKAVQSGTGNRGPGCVCEHCICIDCKGTADFEPEETPVKVDDAPTGEKGTSIPVTPKESKATHPIEDEETPIKVDDAPTGEKGTSIPVTPKESKATHPIDCDCPECKCPGESGDQTVETKPVSAKPSAKIEALGDSSMEPPPFEIPLRIDCNCKDCTCQTCDKMTGAPIQDKMSKNVLTDKFSSKVMFVQPSSHASEAPIQAIMSKNVVTDKLSSKAMFVQPSSHASGAPIQDKMSKNVVTDKISSKEMSVQPSSHASGAPIQDNMSKNVVTDKVSSKVLSMQPSYHPSRVQDNMSKNVVTEKVSSKVMSVQPSHQASGAPIQDNMSKNVVTDKVSSKVMSVQPSHQASGAPIQDKMSKNVVTEKVSTKAMSVQPSSHAYSLQCDCPTCTCEETELSVISRSTPGVTVQSADTVVLPKPDLERHKIHDKKCDCPECKCTPCMDPKRPTVKPSEQIKQMDSKTLKQEIQTHTIQNCECKDQIEEIKRTLDKIKCACTEAEVRTSNSAAKNKPFVKQASVFGQTMSGLKMALNNLQSKCKAKDRMIEAMTSELHTRGNDEVFDKVLQVSQNMPQALDYDQADDVKSIDRSQIVTNIILGVAESKEQGTEPCNMRCVASKGVEVRTHKHKKKHNKKINCSCSIPQIVQKEQKDCEKMDLDGFEVTDVRRITDDSLIVKWNAPKNEEITGYDIYVNGCLASKVMSGTRTSAMMHSLDLSKTVQITIYVVTRCGRCEPPAIAIYEIKS